MNSTVRRLATEAGIFAGKSPFDGIEKITGHPRQLEAFARALLEMAAREAINAPGNCLSCSMECAKAIRALLDK